MSGAADLTAEIGRLQKLISEVAASVVRVEQFATLFVNEHSVTRRSLIDAVRDLNEADLRLQRVIEERQQED